MVRSSRPAGRGLRLLCSFAAAAVLALGAVAMAAGDDRAATEALLKQVEGASAKEVVQPLTIRARAAQERAAKLRASGDEAHAKLADGVARSWAEAARDVARATAVEESARATRLAATDAGVVADRERALLEEAVAQNGLLRTQLEAAEREGKDQPARTSTAAANGDAGTRAAPRSDARPKTTRDGGVR